MFNFIASLQSALKGGTSYAVLITDEILEAHYAPIEKIKALGREFISKFELKQSPVPVAYLPAAQGAHLTVPAQDINMKWLNNVRKILRMTHSSLILLISDLMCCSVVV
jgi:hypothetical protein